MEWLFAVLTVIAGLLIRLALPIALTALMIWALRRMDQRWQTESEPALSVVQAQNTGCWDAMGCSEELRAGCPCYAHPEAPCWQVKRQQTGRLPERCLGCKVFRQAPIPVTS